VGYPLVRVDKLHPDGSPRASWYGYRIPDRDGSLRVYAPPRTRRIHVGGLWTPPGWMVSAFHPEWRFVPHRWVDGATNGTYVDLTRSTSVRRDRVEFVDLYLDVSIRGDGVVFEKDEELLERLTVDEAAMVRATRDELRRRIASAEPPFSADESFWQVPDDARALPPRMRRRTRAWLGR
jgi:hypothetical protein